MLTWTACWRATLPARTSTWPSLWQSELAMMPVFTRTLCISDLECLIQHPMNAYPGGAYVCIKYLIVTCRRSSCQLSACNAAATVS